MLEPGLEIFGKACVEMGRGGFGSQNVYVEKARIQTLDPPFPWIKQIPPAYVPHQM